MTSIAVIGAGITGVTTAYALVKQGFTVTLLDRQRYPAMDTSFANGGQLSACNAEVWNNTSTVMKGIKWMFKKDAPLLVNPSPSWHKYTWMGEFLRNIRNYEHNTIETTKLAIAAREHLFQWAEDENIDFDLEKRGILHVYQSKAGFESGVKVSELLAKGGLERRTVTPEEIRQIEPTLVGQFYGGFFTPSDASGDIHKFTRGLADACKRLGVKFTMDVEVESITPLPRGHQIRYRSKLDSSPNSAEQLDVDAIVICAGVGSRKLAAMVGDHINIYPVKGYSITVNLNDEISQNAAPWVSLLDEEAKIVTSRLGATRLRVAGTAEYNGENKNIRADRIAPLTEWTRRNFNQAATDNVVPWAGLRPMMPDMMPRVQAGKREGIFYNTGHGHLGWTLSAATAQTIAYTIRTALPVTADA
ncbi:D-amino acid dehydrogenase [Paenalcaligenes niemegkensis]|uniref:D-amino acid dehydrogenase n=1 Tax=Paenalcaligenes niemegkensis TaxID=2895469 RepID=UPI001EE8523D|nr:D-amino acid dehydrogenase [Paenalcaligenes niemegkensis]MCQ9616515.1 D-amino acid dehydrogenase [Paenalcaligenes niemegkensis]